MPDTASLVRSLLLPLGESNFSSAVDFVDSFFSTKQIDDEDRQEYLQNALAEWRDSGVVPKMLKQLIGGALARETYLSPGFRTKYFSVLLKLQSRSSLLSFEQARGLLSNAFFIDNMLDREGMSAAQIALVLNASQNQSGLTWRHVQLIADALDRRPRLDAYEVAVVHDADVYEEPSNFADASPDESILVISRKARELGYPGDLSEQLDKFLDVNSRVFESAFAIVLHASALITQFYNHPLSQAAYEFNPRGQILEDAMRVAHPSYQATESAYLNNAKGTFAFDSNWAWGRLGGNTRQAHALVSILDGLGEMAYAPRRELAGWIRQWLLRIERVRSGSFVHLSDLTRHQARNAIESIVSSNSSSHGILEQRLIDLVATELYGSLPQWRVRGVGDSVNASNLAKRKLGDLDVENASDHHVIALEPHGGILSDVYVQKHRASLRSVLRLRADEFELVAPRNDWKVEVVFIAHGTRGLQPFTETIEGFVVNYSFVTYAEFLSSFDWNDSSLDAFNDFVVGPISESWVPDEIRTALLEIAN